MFFFNYLFYLLLFVGFFLPTNSSYFLPIPGVLLGINELAFLLLPLLNIFCFSKNRIIVKDKRLIILIILIIFSVFFIEFVVKPVAYGQTIPNSVKSIRIGLPLFSSLIILISGIRADIKIVWNTLLWAIGASVLISLISLIIPLPIYYDLEDGADILSSSSGRLINSNSSFGIIGLYLLFKDKEKWYNSGKLVTYVSLLSIIALITSFNRTYLMLIVLEFCYLSYVTFSRRNFLKIIFTPVLFFLIGFFAYSFSEVIERQIDRRILSIIFQETSLVESTVDNNRDIIYDGITDKISRGFWVIGLPLNIPIFSTVKRGLDMNLTVTDTSLVNVLLRHGILSLILLISILFICVRLDRNSVFSTALIFYFLASLNIDSLYAHNSIFFLFIVFIITNFHNNESSISRKN